MFHLSNVRTSCISIHVRSIQLLTEIAAVEDQTYVANVGRIQHA